MGSKRNYAAMAFRRARKGALERGEPTIGENADAARLTAERLATRRGYVGAVAYACGDAEDQAPITIAAFGEVPPEARDALPY